jgi:hypothetical protein
MPHEPRLADVLDRVGLRRRSLEGVLPFPNPRDGLARFLTGVLDAAGIDRRPNLSPVARVDRDGDVGPVARGLHVEEETGALWNTDTVAFGAPAEGGDALVRERPAGSSFGA